MTTIITRLGKCYPLTNIELYSNFTNLNVDKLEVSAFDATANAWLSTKTLSNLSNVQITSPIDGQSLVYNQILGKWTNQTVSGGTGGGLEGGSILASTTGINTLDTFNSTLYSTVKYLIQATSGDKIYSTEVIVLHNGTDVFISEYGSVFTEQLCTFSGEFDGDNVLVKVNTLLDNTYVDYKRVTLNARLELLTGDLMLMSGSMDLMTASGSFDLMQ